MNINQAKALFFANYWGQKVYRRNEIDDTIYIVDAGFIYENGYLLLRSVNDLTDEQLHVFAKHSAYRLDEKNINSIGRVMINHLFGLNRWSGNTILLLTDYLRSIGILLPFTYPDDSGKPITLQPDEIVQLGWAQIIK